MVFYGYLKKKLIMKTLKQLKEKYDKLLKECNILYEEIHTLEEQETFKKVKVGDCFFSTINDDVKKIVSIEGRKLYCLNIQSNFIDRVCYDISNVIDWKNITSEQFDSLFDAVLKDLQDPSSGTTKHYNWEKTLKKVINGINIG